MGITVIKPGLFTTIQDYGRFGYQQLGIVPSGAMDSYALRIANMIVDNQDMESTIEITMMGPTLRFDKSATISIFGANMSPEINGIPVQTGKPLLIQRGEIVSFRKLVSGARCYLAVHGGIQVPKILDSKSTYVKGRIGGLNGLPLKAQDIIPIQESRMNKRAKWFLAPEWFQYCVSKSPIRIIEGKQFNMFNKNAKRDFLQTIYKIQSNSDRMGYRLQGEPLSLSAPKELITEGVTMGSIQVPPDGQPIILMADRQTTGGYPKIAQVASVDLPILAQKKPGDEIHFEMISLEAAQSLLIEREKQLRVLKKMIKEQNRGEVQYVQN
ncbi:biotin-dependent carboxyltransferase family protein [Bacillus sp. 31A1R]|uniref:Biotin-dependent carboxyltransferase family protein n=1 Tax=Robertmurraya mangrovi TaxID=3098077 RepID=A0ABU5IWT5_9BACI|nr:biotin-dependent carboxyltransferase family protein [Bacillus sp. 31A1R]MDZ5471628.1 biotin-dependent carboxyltransferase family protein [Bacillus sp. 31A1R]